MSTLRNLLARGNGKLGENIHSWSLPAVSTCPGRSALCERLCYARAGHFSTPPVQNRYWANLQTAQADDFAARMTSEVRRRWVQVCRVHVSGDFFSAEYARAWLDVIQSCPRTRFYAYTRSWRVAAILPELHSLAELQNLRLWFSADRETGLPVSVPVGVRVAWLQDGSEPLPQGYDLVFLVRSLRRLTKRRSLPLVCPAEVADKPTDGIDCGRCGKCWR